MNVSQLIDHQVLGGQRNTLVLYTKSNQAI